MSLVVGIGIKMNEFKQLLTLQEVCTILQCHPNTLRLWDKKGILKAVRIGERHTRRYKYEDIQKIVSSQFKEEAVDHETIVPNLTKQFPKESEEALFYSEMRFRTLVEQSPLSKHIFNSKGESIIANRSWEKLWGIKHENLKNYNIFKDEQFISWGLMPLIKKAFAGKVVEIPSFKYLPKNKTANTTSYRWMKGLMYPIKDTKGNLREVVFVQEDITTWKNAQDKLNYLAVITENIADAIISTDKNGKISTWNSGAELLYGWKAAEVLGTPAELYLTPLKSKAQIINWREIAMKYGHWQREVKQKRKNGETIYVNANTSLIKEENGSVIGYVTINRDITKSKLIEENITFLSEAIEILNSSLNYQKTFKSIARLAVPKIADWCAVQILDSENRPMQVALAHIDPKKAAWAREINKNPKPIDFNEPTGLPKVLKSGNSEFYPYISPEIIIKAAQGNKKQLQLLKKLDLTALIISPLKVKGKTIGAITFVSAESKRRYTKADLKMAEQLASRASLAIENSLLYDEVEKERLRLTNLVSNVPSVVWEWWGKPDDSKQRFDFVSEYVEKMLGYTVNEWITTPNFWLKIVHPEDQKRAADESAAFFARGRGGISSFRWKTKYGKTLWVEAQSFVILDKAGKSIGMRGVTIDVSERMEMERRKDEFISMASHELKTPITSIKVFTQILQNMFKKQNEVRTLSYLDRMNKQIEKLSLLVNDLLDVSKIQAGKLELRKEIISIKKLLVEVVEIMQTTTDDHKLVLNNTTDEKLYADSDRISQVLINLISNAIKYSPNNKTIVVESFIRHNEMIVSVADKGVGISEEHQHKIFDRFYRVFDNRDKTFPGLGMGLYISNEIVKRHGGKMWVKSVLGEGSTFYFALPILEL